MTKVEAANYKRQFLDTERFSVAPQEATSDWNVFSDIYLSINKYVGEDKMYDYPQENFTDKYSFSDKFELYSKFEID